MRGPRALARRIGQHRVTDAQQEAPVDNPDGGFCVFAQGWSPKRTTAFLRLLNEVVVLLSQLSDLFS